jgi:hypothetical protein
MTWPAGAETAHARGFGEQSFGESEGWLGVVSVTLMQE